MTAAAPSNYVFWLAGRSAGFVAMLLVTVSVILGLSMAARVIPSRWRRQAIDMHQHLALLSLGAIGAHGVLLALDPWLKAGPKGILIPFTIGYRPLWTGLGVIGGYLAAILGLSYYARRRIGARLWRKMHRFTVVVYGLSLAHVLGSGTDASIPEVRYGMLSSLLPVLFLFALRVQRTRSATASRSAAGREKAPETHGTSPSTDVSGAAVRPGAHGGEAPGRSRPRASLEPSASQAR